MILKDRIALVTGAGSGIGAAAAVAFAQAGADVALASRTSDETEEVAATIERLGRRALPVPADIADEVDAKRLFSAIKRKFKRLDIVVEGSVHKFAAHDDLRAFLLNTGERVLVEASPVDRVWGIGLAAGDEGANDPERWRGPNLLGFALMEARRRLRTG